MALSGSKTTSKLHTVLRELINRTNSNIMRLRIIEQETEITKRRMGSLEKSFLAQKKELAKSLKEFETSLKELEKRIERIESALKQIVAELKRTATKSELKEIEHLVDIYNPIKSNFVTRDEIEEIIEEKVKELQE